MAARLVSLYLDADGIPWLAHGSPHAFDELRILLCAALRPDIAPLKIERASPVIRTVPPEEPLPHPETCVPYREATGMGFVLRPSLPLLFVRNRGGELLPDAATALAYARDHAIDFKSELDVIADFASTVLEPAVVRRYERRASLLFRDLAQPYSLFGPSYYSVPAGLYVQTDPGIGTVIGPPLNRAAKLPVVTGLIRTDWHHHGLFVVVAPPPFDGRSLLVLPDDDLAQMYFVDHASTIVLEHSLTDRGGDPDYEARWWPLVAKLGEQGRGVLATRSGVASVSLACSHCRAAITEAVDGDLPPDHHSQGLFVPAYKEMRRDQDAALTEKPSAPVAESPNGSDGPRFGPIGERGDDLVGKP